ncbi:GvpL/GvpF family gas vesicle protein [Streptomonospora sp. S1-112]|uniref:GvpL/GvpF family gas vesicle protein n=1 Tax=Streptomonospora mangrovi TaxID=2883123 RepID=A0A9X3NRX5_9ACTN|nr:GvpL/GvpF family gas vesicle protein [Streptomonospora mangrovi]MDA0567181.1 GvpL/GvpF family gas vesicle protein [Streptomonospora mangrovi]
MSAPQEASYVYAVARPFAAEAVAGLAGVGGYPVHLVAHEGLAAVVSAVPLHEFDEEALRANLEDLGWLEEVARAHHTVVDAAARHTDVVPLRLATVYHGDERVRSVLAEGRASFERALGRVAGCVEFGVKVYADPATRTPAGAEKSSGARPGESPGMAYLRKRREQRDRRDDTWRTAAELCDRLDASLAEWARARERHRPQDASLSGESGENVLNAAYLVADGDTGAFLDAAQRVRDSAPEGTRIEVSGPWAPYSFAGVEALEGTAPEASEATEAPEGGRP